ncbi:MAG: metal-dependent hydrolase, partial [bacterium]
AVILAFALAAVWTRVAPAFPYPVLTRFAALGVGSHLVLDLLTPRGTPLFWPLSPRQFALSWAGDTDPWLWGILAAGLAAAWAWPVRGIGMARGALAAAAAYVVFCGMARATAISRFEDAVIRLGGRPVRSEAYPRYLDPARWNVVTFGTERCWQGFVNAFGGIEGRVRTYFTPPLPARFDSAFTRAYLAWARAPVARQLAGAGLREVALYDLRFLGGPEGVPHVVRIVDEGGGHVRHEWVPSSMTRTPDADQEYELGK